MELVTVLSSDLFEHDDYIITYLRENPDLSFISVVKIVLRYCITPQLIEQLEDFKVHFKAVNFFMFEEVFGTSKRPRRYS